MAPEPCASPADLNHALVPLASEPAKSCAFDEMVERLRGLGYVYTPESEADDPQRRVLRKGPNDFRVMRTRHLHVTLSGSPYWQRIIPFRDRLRADPDAAARYADLKRELITQHRSDSVAYTAAKTAFVTEIEASLDS